MPRKLRAGAVGAAVFCRFNAVEVSEEGSHIFMPCIACSSGVLHPLGGTRLGREVVKQRERQHFTPGPAFAGPAMDAAAPAAVSLPPAPPRLLPSPEPSVGGWGCLSAPRSESPAQPFSCRDLQLPKLCLPFPAPFFFFFSFSPGRLKPDKKGQRRSSPSTSRCR